TVTGALVTGEELASPDYWVRHVRQTVRFADAVTVLEAEGVTRFLELGPDGTLTALTHASLTEDATAVPALRADRPEPAALLTAAATLHAHGADVTWSAIFPAARPVDLPTYAFQHERYWPRVTGAAFGDLRAVGLAAAGHPLLGAAVTLADSATAVLTGRLSTRLQPWLAQHVVSGRVLLPGTAFLELALHAADHVGCAQVEELTLEAPLVLPAEGAVQLQVTVGAPDADGRREIGVYSRPADDTAADDTEGEPWQRNASGTLLPDAATPAPPTGTRPPADAAPLSTDTLYPRLADTGLAYGPLFRGLAAVRQHGDDLFAEAALPDESTPDAQRYGLHPALLDSVLHALGAAPAPTADTGEPGGPGLPFSWSGVTLHATGATHVHARLRTNGNGTVALDLTDPDGAPVATVDALTLRALTAPPADPAGPGHSGLLHRVARTPLPLDPADDDRPNTATAELPTALPADGREPGSDTFVRVEIPAGDPLRAAHTATARALDLVRDWLAQERFDGARLVFVTESGTAPDDRPADPADAAVRGLVRAAHAENPGRFALLDVDGTTESWAVVRAALATGEPEIAVHGGTATVPRLTRATDTAQLRLPADASAWRLDIVEKGTLEGLALRPVDQGELGEGEVRVSVRAAGVNFRDVLNALGMYPGDARDFGLEGAGVVTEV
ncbi:polyketide synthase dehydratase domain-containing protein, partial [Streptomyces heilongjiangensis]